jgi:outer membrane biosynthesis protein TonB
MPLSEDEPEQTAPGVAELPTAISEAKAATTAGRNRPSSQVDELPDPPGFTPAPVMTRETPPAKRATTPPPAPRSATPAPAPATAAAAAAAVGFSPAGDLSWAAFGTLAALLGSFLLAFLSVWNHWTVMWAGLALSFGGSVLTLAILSTGRLGRRQAWLLPSVVVAFLVALLMSTSLVGTKLAGETLIAQIEFGGLAEDLVITSEPARPEPKLASATPKPEPEPEPEEGLTVEEPDDPRTAGEGDGEPEAIEEEPEPEPQAQPQPQPRPRRPSPAPAPVDDAVAEVDTTPAPAPRPAPAPAPAPAPPPPAAPTGVPIQTIHVLLSNNAGVKSCFVPLLRAGQLPPRVDVKFTLAASGAVGECGVVQPQYTGSQLDRCLAQAIRAIGFPPSSGPGQTITYPFVLQ